MLLPCHRRIYSSVYNSCLGDVIYVSMRVLALDAGSLMGVKKFPRNIPQMYIARGDNETILTQKGVNQNKVKCFFHAIDAYISPTRNFVLVVSSKNIVVICHILTGTRTLPQDSGESRKSWGLGPL